VFSYILVLVYTMTKRSKRLSKREKGRKRYDAYSVQDQVLLFDSPPILIVPREDKPKEQGKTTMKERTSDLKEIEVMVDPAVKALGMIKRKVRILRNPTAEEWIKWLIELEEVCESKPIPDPRRKALAYPQFLAEQAKEIWQKHYRTAVLNVGLQYPVPETETAAARTIRENTIATTVLRETIASCTREFCRVKDPARVEVSYLRRISHMYGMSIRKFANRLKQINDYLPYFPPYSLDEVDVEKLRDSELITIMISAKPRAMTIDVAKANVDLHTMNFEEFVNYLERLEIAAEVQHQIPKSSSGTNATNKKRKDYEGGNRVSNGKPRSFQSKIICTICKKPGHDSSKCWFNKEKGNKPPVRTTNAKSQSTTERAYTLSELKELYDNLPSHQSYNLSPHKKRKITYESSDSSDEAETSNNVHVSDYFRKQRKEA
jgi:hypothetical protein